LDLLGVLVACGLVSLPIDADLRSIADRKLVHTLDNRELADDLCRWNSTHRSCRLDSIVCDPSDWRLDVFVVHIDRIAEHCTARKRTPLEEGIRLYKHN
jgi:hypothetical protein